MVKNKEKKKVTYKPKTTRSKVAKKVPKQKYKLTIVDIVLWVLLVVLLVLGYFWMGIKPILIIIGGNIAIFFLNKLFHKIKKKKSTRRLFNALVIIFLLSCIGGTIAVGGFFFYVVKSAPEFDTDKLVTNESSLIYDSKNVLVAELGAQKRDKVSYDEVSDIFIDALVSIEDSRFFQHNGVDAARFLKAAANQLLGNSSAGGASTLSMQLIKLTYTSMEDSGFKGIVRKFTDIYMSVFELEKTYTKKEILEFYFNNNYLGSQAYGVEQAAKIYFNKNASELNIVEAATLAGIFQSPNSKNPYANIEAATIRRDQVLNLMYRHGYITVEERDMAKAIPIDSLLSNDAHNENEYQGYIDTVVEEAINKYGSNPYNVPMIIYTNMISSKQTALSKVFNGESFTWENDVVQSGVAAVDVWTGKIIAIGAGRNRTGARQFNYATSIIKQIGSTSKPIFDYGPGIEYNNWSTYQLFKDEKYTYTSGQEIRNADREYMGWLSLRDAISFSRNIPALKAFQLVEDQNIIDFVTDLGIIPEIYSCKDGYKLDRNKCISKTDPNVVVDAIEANTLHEAHAIGAFTGSNPLEMAAAYAAFANGGTYYEPYSINKIVYRDTGKTIKHEAEGVRVMSEATAYMITDCLITAVKSGYSYSARIDGVNVAAKTGTTNFADATIAAHNYPDNVINDSWIIGYSPDISVGFWYGYDQLDDSHYSTTTSDLVQRGRIFKAVGGAIFDKNNKDFTVPTGVTKVGIEKDSYPGLLPSTFTPEDQITYEYYKTGTEPTEISNKYVTLPTVENLLVQYDPSLLTTSITWSKVATPEKLNGLYEDTDPGDFGYKIYKNGIFLGFTKKANFTITDDADPYGVYKVATVYEKFNLNRSVPVEYNFVDSNLYRLSLVVAKNQVVPIAADSTVSTYTPPSNEDIVAYQNNIDVTYNVNVDITIKNENGTVVTAIDTSQAGRYIVTYKVTFLSDGVILQETRNITVS